MSNSTPWKNGFETGVFETLRLLGHEDDVRRWATQGIPKPFVVPLTRYGDNHYSRWFPNTGF